MSRLVMGRLRPLVHSHPRLSRMLLAACLTAGVVLVPATASSAAAAPVPTPTVANTPAGPFFNQAPVDLAARGFTDQEFFFSGNTTFGAYMSRMIVRRPVDPERFNGTVIVEWMNASSGNDLDVDFLPSLPLMEEQGFAYVGVTAQQVTVNFLRTWDPARYGSLNMTEGVATQPAAFEVFSQAGMALRENGSGIDPMGGLEVERLIAIGQSQSAGRLTTYIDTIHDIVLEPVFDAFIPHAGGAAPTRSPVPIIKLNSENEAPGYFGQRGVAHPLYRYWEVPGSAHSPLESNEYAISLLELVRGSFPRCPFPYQGPGGPVPIDPVLRAAIFYLDRWVRTGEPAPHAPLIEMVPGANPNVGVIQRDQYGNGTGGIRMPQQEVPTGRNSPSTGCLVQFPPFGTIVLGSFPQWDAWDGDADPANDPADMFEPEPAGPHEVYRNHGGYVSRFAAAVRAAENAGFLLRFDAQNLRTGAALSDIAK